MGEVVIDTGLVMELCGCWGHRLFVIDGDEEDDASTGSFWGL